MKALSLAVCAALFLTGCGHKASDQGGDVVKIGLAAPLTGPQAQLGQDMANGARLAVDEINAGHPQIGGKPVTFRLLAEDDQADPKTATNVAQRLVDDGVAAVIGHMNSGTTIPASRIYYQAGIAQISPSATAVKYTHQGFDTAFRVMANDAQQGTVLGDFAVKTLGAHRIAIIDDRTAYGQGLADQFERTVKALGADVVDREYTTDHSTDFMAILTNIKAKKPDLVFFGGMDPQAGPMIRQMRQLGISAKFLGGDGVRTPQFITLAGPAAEGAYASTPGLPIGKMPKGPEFQAKYTAKYGPIQQYAPYAYDAVYVLAGAMEKAGSADPKTFLPVLRQTDYQGVTGPIRFDANGDLTQGAITLYQVQKGAWVPLQTFQKH